MSETAVARLDRYRREPVAFMEEVLGFRPWSKQQEIACSVRDHPRTAVRSCHSVGKTAIAARIALWFHAVWEDSVVVTTAKTAHQVRHQLWREIKSGWRQAGGFIGGEIYHMRLEQSDRWFMSGFTSDTTEGFAGWHAEHILLVVDEASGVDEAIFEAAEGALAGENSRMLLIGNPTQTSGAFYDAFHSARRHYSTIHISALDAPCFTGEDVDERARRSLVSRSWVDGRREHWGEQDPRFQVRVLGEFPSQADYSVISLASLEQAQNRALDPGPPYVISADVARYGRDETVIAERSGSVVRIAAAYRGLDTMHTAGAIAREARRVLAETGRRPRLVVDDDGVGGGVVDRLKELGEFEVIRFRNAASSTSREYKRRRDEAWFTFSERLPELDLPKDEHLATDLLAPVYKLDSEGRRVVEPKDDTRRRLRRSPDRADAVIMAFAIDRRYRRARTSNLRRVLANR